MRETNCRPQRCGADALAPQRWVSRIGAMAPSFEKSSFDSDLTFLRGFRVSKDILLTI